MVDAAPGTTRAVNRKTRMGTVVSDKGDQTVIVAIERAAPHRLYHKVIRTTKRYAVHDPENAATMGDMVRIEECRPISKTKRWRLVEIVQEREVAQVAAEAIDASLVSEVQRAAARAAEEEGATPVSAAEPSGEGAEDAGGVPAEGSQPIGTEEPASAEAAEASSEEEPVIGAETEVSGAEARETEAPAEAAEGSEAPAGDEATDEEAEPKQQ